MEISEVFIIILGPMIKKEIEVPRESLRFKRPWTPWYHTILLFSFIFIDPVTPLDNNWFNKIDLCMQPTTRMFLVMVHKRIFTLVRHTTEEDRRASAFATWSLKKCLFP